MIKNNYPSIIKLSSLNDSPALPILFDDVETPDIPAILLPGVFGEFAMQLANATETPESLSVMTILGVISACVSKRFVVSPKDGWFEPINIYTLIALPPANHKSFVLSTCTKPLVEWEHEQTLVLSTTIKRQRSERKNQEKHIECLRAAAGREKDLLTQKQLFAEINELETNLIEPAVLPSLFANDATPESLALNLFEQKGRYALFSDEGGILETLAGLYSNGSSNVDILLKGIDGGDVRVRRRDRCFNLNPYLTLVLAVQPTVIRNLAEKRAYLGNGTLERFLYVIPKSKLGYRTHNNPAVSNVLKNAYHSKIKLLLNISPLIQNNEEQPRVLTLTSDAYQEWREFQNAIEIELRPEGKLSICLGWGGKICGFALRIAGLLQIAEDINSTAISFTAITNALDIAAKLIQHAQAAFGLMVFDQVIDDAKEVFNWIITNGQLTYTQSQISYGLRNRKVGKAERLHKALKVLVDRNILFTHTLPTLKPTFEYHLHPQLLANKN